MKPEHLIKHALGIGCFAVILYIACLLWRFTMTDPAVMQFHLLSLKTLFPGFTGFDLQSQVWGGALSFIYGFLISITFHSLHKNCGCDMKK